MNTLIGSESGSAMSQLRDATTSPSTCTITTIEEDRDLVPLGDELGFVERCVSLERLRFGERLRVSVVASPDAACRHGPTFALQTLVENAVRHGAPPRTARTDIAANAVVRDDMLSLTVVDTCAGCTEEQIVNGTGSGIRRLRARLTALYGNAASLRVRGRPSRGGCDRYAAP